MSVCYYDPFAHFEHLLDEAFLTRSGMPNRRPKEQSDGLTALRPKMNLHEDAETNVVTATFEFPGLKKEDVQVDVHNGRLTVSGESKMSSEHEQEGYAVRERQFGKFSRTLQMPQGIKDDQIKASMEHGVLTVTFPKSSPEQAPKKIAIS